MALTSDQITELTIYQGIVSNLISILDKETTLHSEIRVVSGLSNANIANINNTIEFSLNAIDTIINPLGILIPHILSFSPTTGEEGDTVTITGVNFTDVTDVEFNGTPAVITSNTDTEIVCDVPSGATTGPITVITPGGTEISTSDFTVTYAP